MEEVAIYKTALTAAQVQAHYASASNRAPVFVSNPFHKGNVNAGQFFSGSLSTNATDPNGDSITWAKVSGPSWLTVAANGFTSGTPANGNANTNLFVVSARDAAGLSNSASMSIYVNGAPIFAVNPFDLPAANAGDAYNGTVATNASDPNPSDLLTFAKLSGPDWLEVGTNGVVSGVPGNGEAGTNSFVISVTDPAGLIGNATLTIQVIPVTPIRSSLVMQGADLLLNWTGGSGPYRVEMTTDLTSTNWQEVASGLEASSFVITPTNSAAFYRILEE
jgi:hypothetical protein